MSKKTPSQGFSYNFEIVFDKEKETTLQKIKRWISKQKPPLNIILKYLFSYIEKWYWDGKVLQTMAGVDLETKKLHEHWEENDRQSTPHILETGVFGKEGWSIQISICLDFIICSPLYNSAVRFTPLSLVHSACR